MEKILLSPITKYFKPNKRQNWNKSTYCITNTALEGVNEIIVSVPREWLSIILFSTDLTSFGLSVSLMFLKPYTLYSLFFNTDPGTTVLSHLVISQGQLPHGIIVIPVLVLHSNLTWAF